VAGFYQRHVLPHLVDLAMKQPLATERRSRLIPQATGAVLEVGVGSGLNFPFYGPRIARLHAVDPSPELLEMARRRASKLDMEVEFECVSAEALPYATASMDTVVTTWTLCSIPDAASALSEMRRVLKPDGTLLFVEHGRAPDASVRKWQDRLDPLWTRVAGGCHLNRPMAELIRSAGFALEKLDTSYSPGPRPITYMYEGRAAVSA
jgi:ubiquinone/menaquinone biosynthesis C-methylase UbiE